MSYTQSTIPLTNPRIRDTLDTMSSDLELDVIIVGAGIAGLSTAIALRREGHRVTVHIPSSVLV